MNFSSFIAGRIAFNSQHSFSRFIIRLAIAATAISVMAMILTIAFAQGFKHAIAEKMYGFSGHVRVQHYIQENNLISNDSAHLAEMISASTGQLADDSVIAVIRQDPEVKYFYPYATKDAILKGPESFEGLKLKGIAPGFSFDHIQVFQKTGHWIEFPDSGYSNQINLSTYTANQLKLKAGDKIFTYFIQPDGSKRVRPMIVAGTFKTGIENYDRVNALVDLRLIQRLNNWTADQIMGYEIFLKNYEMADSVSSRLYDQLPRRWTSASIEEIYGNIFDWLNLQDTTIIIVIVIMILVAILNLVTCLIILLLERTHMIGILKAIGSRDSSIQKVFLFHGAIITFGGLILGNILGLAVYWLQNRYGFIKLSEESYFISKAVAYIRWPQVLWVNLGTFIVCFLVLLLPSFLIIRRMSPAKAIAFS